MLQSLQPRYVIFGARQRISSRLYGARGIVSSAVSFTALNEGRAAGNRVHFRFPGTLRSILRDIVLQQTSPCTPAADSLRPSPSPP